MQLLFQNSAIHHSLYVTTTSIRFDNWSVPILLSLG